MANLANPLIYSTFLQITLTAVTGDWRVFVAFTIGQIFFPIAYYLASVRLEKRQNSAIQWASDPRKAPLIRPKSV